MMLTAFVAVRLPYLYESYKICELVKNGLLLAAPLKEIVEKNAAMILALDSGLLISGSREGILVTIFLNNEVITIVFDDEVFGAQRTLTLVPLVFSGPADDYAFTGISTSSLILFPGSQVNWVCASAETITYKTTVIRHKGTLPSKYTPLECRW
jgi:hypothetical protein